MLNLERERERERVQNQVFNSQKKCQETWQKTKLHLHYKQNVACFDSQTRYQMLHQDLIWRERERERESLKNQVLNSTKEMPGNLTKDQTEITLQTKYSMLWCTNKVPNVFTKKNKVPNVASGSHLLKLYY